MFGQLSPSYSFNIIYVPEHMSDTYARRANWPSKMLVVAHMVGAVV